MDGGKKTLRKCSGDRTKDEVSRREDEKNQRRGNHEGIEAGVLHTAAMWVRHWLFGKLFPQNGRH